MNFISTIKNIIKQSAKILTIGITLNLGRFLFLIIGAPHYIARGRILLGAISCIIFPFLYMRFLKINLIPMASTALFRSFQNDLDGLSQQLSTHLINIHHQVHKQTSNIPPKTIRVIQKISKQLLGMDTEEIFNSLENTQPDEQINELKGKLYASIQEKIKHGKSGWSIVIINLFVLAAIFIGGLIL